MKRAAAPLLALFLALAGCVHPKVATNPKADFSKIRRIGVVTFSGPNGGAAADIMTQDLVSTGIDVVERQRLDSVMEEHRLTRDGMLDPETTVKLKKILGVDAIMVGSVTSFSPGQSYLVQTDDAAIRVGDSVTPLNSRNVYPGGSVLGIPNTQVVSTAANVGLTARLVDAETGSIMWSARMSYEGFDTDAAMAIITGSFAKSLSKLWPNR